MPLISIVTACFNEEENVREVYEQVKAVCSTLHAYQYEHIFIDNASTDNTAAILKEIAAADANIKVIINNRNFGHIRSPCHGLLQAQGDAVISIVADLQDPPTMIIDFIKQWEAGYKVVAGVKAASDESKIFFAVRKFYYSLLNKFSNIQIIKNFTGFGLYDKQVIESLRNIDDAYPYFRGLISELGYKATTIEYHQPQRTRGFSKNNLYSLYDMAMLGITSHSKVPLRLAIFFGFIIGTSSFAISIFYLIYKLILWHSFDLGTAPLIIGIFFLASIQLFFIGIVGEYVGAIHTQVMKRPLVVEKERINF
jgi:polyisoprenyl-phosphate glycosyltransferase